MKKTDAVVHCFNSGYNCSQTVFSTYCSELGLDEEMGLTRQGFIRNN